MLVPAKLNKKIKMKKKEKTRKFLYEDEIQLLLDAAKETNYPIRDQAILLLTYNHGFRAGEVCKLVWEDIDFKRNTIKANRQKGGVDFTHELNDMERGLLLELRGEKWNKNDIIFISNRENPFSRFTLYFLIRRLLEKVELDTWASTHSLRHSKGVFLRKKKVPMDVIRDFMGHKHMSSTEIYTRMCDTEFKGINEGSIFV